VSEANRNRLIVIAAILFWIVTILDVIQLVVEGSSVINWASTIIFLALAIYYSYLGTRAYK
jgi:hypothetical protein